MTTTGVAVVTGAGSGLGREIARALLGAGWRVAAAGRREDALREAVSGPGLPAGARAALPVVTDVTEPGSVAGLFETVRGRWGRVDLLVNNAGIFGPGGAVDEISVPDWRRAVDTNLTGAFLCAQQAVRGVTVVATVRKDDWDAWLNASGAKAPAARAVAERARVFELPAALSRDELAKAAALYPGREFGPGIGATLASDGREQLPPSPPPELEGGMGEPTSDTPWFRDPPLIVPLVATALALVACAIVVATKGWRTPSIQDQLTSIKHKGSLGGTRSVIIHTADLHGNGDNSYIVYFRDRTAQSPRSDELRIYDKHGETLRRAFRFAPTGRRAQFEYRALLDVDGDGATELVGGWDFPDEARNAMVPFAVDWDDGANRYNLVPLDLGAPKLKPHAVKLAKNFRVPAKQYLTLYAAPTTFRTRATR